MITTIVRFEPRYEREYACHSTAALTRSLAILNEQIEAAPTAALREMRALIVEELELRK